MDKTRGGGGGGVEGGDGKGVGGKLGLRGWGTRHPTWNIIPRHLVVASKQSEETASYTPIVVIIKFRRWVHVKRRTA